MNKELIQQQIQSLSIVKDNLFESLGVDCTNPESNCAFCPVLDICETVTDITIDIRRTIDRIEGCVGKMSKHERVEEIIEVGFGYIQIMGNGEVTRWELLNHYIGYYGNINKDHIEAIQYLLRGEYILP